MKRRDFIALASAAAAFPRIALAQQADKVWRIAQLNNGIRDASRQAILDGLADYGYINGKNVSIEWFNAPSIDDISAYAARAVASNPDLIITSTSPPPLAVKALTTTIPVVMTGIQDPVAIGVVDSYARPGGNLTGFMQGGPQYSGNQIELIHEVLPNLSRLADVGIPSDPARAVTLAQRVAAAKVLNIETVVIDITDGDDLVPVFDRAAKSAEAVYVDGSGYLKLNYAPEASLTIDRRLPPFSYIPTAVPSGFLLGYGANVDDLTRRAMSYADAIFKSARPADLPIQEPTTFDLAINMTTAKALGITFPQSILPRATQVIE